MSNLQPLLAFLKKKSLDRRKFETSPIEKWLPVVWLVKMIHQKSKGFFGIRNVFAEERLNYTFLDFNYTDLPSASELVQTGYRDGMPSKWEMCIYTFIHYANHMIRTDKIWRVDMIWFDMMYLYVFVLFVCNKDKYICTNILCIELYIHVPVSCVDGPFNGMVPVPYPLFYLCSVTTSSTSTKYYYSYCYYYYNYSYCSYSY